MTLPALSAVGYAGRPALIGCMAILPRVEAIGVGTSGTVGSGALTLPKLIMRSANFAEMRATMPKLRGLGIQEPANEAFLSGAPLMTAPLSLTALVTMQVDSAASITSDAAAQTVVAGTLNSAASVTSDLAINAVFNAALDSVLIGAAYQSIDGDSDEVGGDQTWVVNAETSASSVYEGFAFNSYAVIGGQLYGARSDGLYLLEGDDDDGVPIRASMSFGSTSFGTAMLKRMESAYIGVSSAGTMYLKVILKDGENYTYAARRSDGFQAQQRFDVGRGIRASHLTFELYNSDGCDFELNTVTFVAAELTRKV